jgi:release factor glutamine methyltransferase
MKISQALAWGQETLTKSGIATARLDALVLLEDNLKLDRAHILAEPDEPASESALRLFRKQINQRAEHLPLAYIRAKTEFYGREFVLTAQVLEPRPESEAMIEEYSALPLKDSAAVIDVGTGSGAIIITAQLERPHALACATDISDACLHLAAKNAVRYNVKLDLYKGDLIKPIPPAVWEREAIVLANLPYVPDSWQLNPPAMREPKIAIFGGPDGLRLYRRLFKQLLALSPMPQWVLTEALPPQHNELSVIAHNSGYKLIKTNDFIQVFKKSSGRA